MGPDRATDLVYADEDAVMPDGERGDAFFKPGWSPELLLSTDYVGPLVAIGPRAARAALAADQQAPQTIYEVLLRVVDAPLKVERIPQVLFTSHAPRIPADDLRIRDAIARLAARRGRSAQVVSLEQPGARDVRWQLDGAPLVSVVIPTSFAGGRLTDCLRSLRERTSYSNIEAVIVDSSPGLAIDELLAGLPHRVVPYRGSFNFSTAVNMGARAASGDCLLVLNDDTEVRSPDWVQRMLEHVLAPGVGVVGATLLYPGGTVQHAGVAVAAGATGSWHVHWGLPGDAPGHHGMLQMTRNHSAVTGACMMVETKLFAELGGFDESFVSEFGDLDLCLRAIERGRRVVCTQRAVLTHHERSSLPMRLNAADCKRFTERWAARYAGGDPFYHPACLPPSYELPTQPGGPRLADCLPPMDAPGPHEGSDALPAASAIEEFESPPPTVEGLVESIASGGTAMWCEAPPLDGNARAVGYLDVSGWAYSRAGIDGVSVYLDGLRYRARHGVARPDLTAVSDELGGSGFELTIELAEHQAGPMELAVVAHGADGQRVGMRGTVECRPGSGVYAMPEATDGSSGTNEAILARLALADERRREAERMLDELQHSLSWRVTRPLRWGKRWLRRRWPRPSS
jgi:GT2 family glycosyltransferase